MAYLTEPPFTPHLAPIVCHPRVCPDAAVMVRLNNVRMRSMLLLVQLLSTCSGLQFEQPDEYSCEKSRPTDGTNLNWRINEYASCFCSSGTCTLDVALDFGPVIVPGSHTGLNSDLRMLSFHTPDSAFTTPGPTLRVRAGDTLLVLLTNKLAAEFVNTSDVAPNNIREFDKVNMHTHGLHISPRAPGDEVVNTLVKANDSHRYIYEIPKDHMGGTHWCK